MAKIRRGKRKAREHEGEVEYLIAFLGYDFLKHVARLAKVQAHRETIEVAGDLMSGYFTLRVTFNGAEKH